MLLLSLCVLQCHCADSFSYDNQTAWNGSCNTGMRQSPILINTSTVIFSNTLPPLTFQNWNTSLSGIFKNDGKSVDFIPNDTTASSVMKNGVTYYVCQFHFHWGAGDTNGTEHQIDGTKYSAELHIVTVTNASYCSSPGLLTAPDSVLVIGVLCKAKSGISARSTYPWSQLMVPLMYSANNSVAGVKYSDFLPASLDYYFYNGSLTTPSCSETVQWYVLKNTIDIPSDFVVQMRMIQIANGSNVTLPYNVRNLQPLMINGRSVYSNSPSPTTTPTSTSPTPTPTSQGVSEILSRSVPITILGFVAAFLYTGRI